MPLILSGNVASATAAGYEVANSCRFNDGDSPHMEKEFSAGSATTWTVSVWVKRGTLGANMRIFTYGSDGDPDDRARFLSEDTIEFQCAAGGELTTTRKFRDCSAWYHLVFVYDSTNGTAGNRMRMYVNGTEETVFTTDTNPSSSLACTGANVNGEDANIGRDGYGGGEQYFDGYMAEFVHIDGTIYAASDFGEFDEDSPTIWKPKDVSGLSFGANGFYLDFEDSSNLGNDANGGTDLTESNLAAADQATDTPTNNFVTLNPLIRWGTNNSEFKEGNLVYDDSRGDWRSAIATFGATSGKWYWEMKLGGGTYHQVGIVGTTSPTSAQNLIDQTAVHGGYSFYNTNGDLQARTDNSAISGWDTSTLGTTAETDDILQVALDMDNKFLYFGKNGTFLKSGDPTSGATGTGGINISADYTSGVVAIPGVTMYDSSDGSLNFGSPAFTISSGNADADGYGNFEYAVPSGYYALCTKNSAEYG